MSQPITLTLARKAPRPLRWFGVLLLLGLLSMPFLALLPATHPLAVSTWLLTLTGKILCYAIVAVALDLVWGYAGMLSLGHGIFFALGGYAMGMYLMRQAAGDGLPAFMSFFVVERAAVVLVGHPAFRLGYAAGGAGARPAGAGFRLVCLPLENQRRLFFDYDPGAHLRRDAAVFP
ncbi:Urea ABC transporter [Klebsiella michiganensis]|uniref:Urea ABC transporter n=1 Tax=Klebsiella michiganensis TaxID=1134687 RepID=A0A7H4MYI8_9ENTR|nr:Urea ABC transporter [Klebsiella michiganensis]